MDGSWDPPPRCLSRYERQKSLWGRADIHCPFPQASSISFGYSDFKVTNNRHDSLLSCSNTVSYARVMVVCLHGWRDAWMNGSHMHSCMHHQWMDVCTKGWMHSPMNRCVHWRMDKFTDGWMHAPKDRCKHQRMDAWMDGWWKNSASIISQGTFACFFFLL